MVNIVKVLGGLGNQMFQYAFYLSLKKKQIDAKLDISDFDSYSLHNGFELLNVFNVDKKDIIANSDEIDVLKDRNRFFKHRKKIGKICFNNSSFFIHDSHFIEENFSEYSPDILNEKDKYLEGYWQNEKYFIDIRDEICENFTWKNVSNRNLELKDKMSHENSVSVHIRRLDQPKSFKELLYRIRLSLVWRTCSKSYYLNAIKKIDCLVDSPNFYIFTDNIPWVKKNIALKPNYKIVDWNRGENSNQDLYLMSNCKHNIISMSSFSWWGAWLNKNPNKIVIAPKKWAVRFSSKVDIIPNNWFKI